MAVKYKTIGLFVLVVGAVLIPIIAVSLNFINKKSKNEHKLVINEDGGADDAMAIFMALLYEKHFQGPEVVGLATSHGNVNEDQAFLNTQRILDIANRRDIPIYRGTNRSLVQTIESDYYYGKDGLGDSTFHTVYDPIEANDTHAVNALIELSKQYEGKLTIVSIGPITNIAMAIRMDPKFITRLEHLYLAAGHIRDVNHPDPEFNALVDVEAYHVAVENAIPDKVTVIPFSQTNSSMSIPRQWREDVLGTTKTTVIEALNSFEAVTIPLSETWSELDPAAMASFLNSEVVKEMRYSNNSIILCGEQRGINTNSISEKNEGENVRILYSMIQDEYTKFLLQVFSTDV